MADGDVGLFLRSHEEVGGVQLIFLKLGGARHGHAVQFFDGVNFVVPESDA